MRIELRATLMAGAATALMMAAGTLPASAATTTWTVTPGGAFHSAELEFSNIVDHTSGNTIRCSNVGVAGTFKKGSGLTNPIGKITAAEGERLQCNSGEYSFYASLGSDSLGLWALRYNASTGLTTGQVRGIDLNLSSVSGYPACSGNLDGTAASANDGEVPFQFSNGTTGDTGGLVLDRTGGNMHAYNVTGCNSLIGSGDSVTFEFAGVGITSASGALDIVTSP
jgi:hypothetical protein